MKPSYTFPDPQSWFPDLKDINIISKFGVWSFSLERIVRIPSDLMHPLLTRIMIASDSSLGGLHKINWKLHHRVLRWPHHVKCGAPPLDRFATLPSTRSPVYTGWISEWMEIKINIKKRRLIGYSSNGTKRRY